MATSGYKNVDPGCYKKWDGDMFMQPWVPDGEDAHSPFNPSARAIFEQGQFDNEGNYNTQVEDEEIQSWIDELSLQLRSLGIQEEDEPHWEDKTWWQRP